MHSADLKITEILMNIEQHIQILLLKYILATAIPTPRGFVFEFAERAQKKSLKYYQGINLNLI